MLWTDFTFSPCFKVRLNRVEWEARQQQRGSKGGRHKRRKSNSLKEIYCKPLAGSQPGGSQSREIQFNNITLAFEIGGMERQYSFPKGYQKPISE